VFGCGDAAGALELVPRLGPADLRRALDRLRQHDELHQPALDTLLEARRHAASRPRSPRLPALLGLLGALGALGSLGSRFARAPEPASGRVHTIPSTAETVRLGVFDATLPNLVELDSGDTVVYPATWSHFENRLQPGVGVDDLAALRRANPGRGPHSIIGPLGVRGAQPGDLLAIHFQRLDPVDWGATFVNPGDLGTGTLPAEFPDGHVRYLRLDRQHQTAEFLPGITLPLGPFQGTVGLAPQVGGITSSVPPGQHAGNIDLRDLTEGSVLYIPVWQPRGKLYTGDSHATQGDGEVNNQALESAMREVRIRVVLHQRPGWDWPFAETDQHWIALGIDADLNVAFAIAVRNTIEFLHRRAGLDRLDAYCLASIGVHFGVSQFVNRTRGVHARIPKALFAPERRASISIA